MSRISHSFAFSSFETPRSPLTCFVFSERNTQFSSFRLSILAARIRLPWRKGIFSASWSGLRRLSFLLCSFQRLLVSSFRSSTPIAVLYTWSPFSPYRMSEKRPSSLPHHASMWSKSNPLSGLARLQQSSPSRFPATFSKVTIYSFLDRRNCISLR